MAHLYPWIDEMRRDLETKLSIYQCLRRSVKRRPVIFTNHDQLWSEKTNPLIRTSEPLTPIPRQYNPRVADISCVAMMHLRDFEREQQLKSFTAIVFEIGVDSPELSPSRVELHVLFSPSLTPVRNPCSLYFNNPCYLPPQPNRSGTLSQPYITKVRVRQYTFGSGAVDSTLSECSLAIVFDAEPSTSVQTVDRPLRRLTFFSCSTTQPLKSQCAEKWSRLGEELRTHLREKLDQFLNRSLSGSRTSIIFTHEPNWWITDLSPTVVVTGPPPPIPDDYDHENFKIEEDVLDYVCEVAKKLHSPELYVSSTRLGAEDNLQMHMLFSDTDELIIWYYENRDKLPLGSTNKPYERRRRVDCEYRQYPGDTDDRSFLKKNFLMSRKLQKLRGRTCTYDFSAVGYSRLDDLRPIAIRLTSVLRIHLEDMLTSFIQRPPQMWNRAFIFTNDESLWVKKDGAVINSGEIPPMPFGYDHNSFDIVQDVVDYIRKYYVRDGELPDPLFVSTLTFGEQATSQIHVIMSQHDDRGRFLYVDSNELKDECELTPSESGISRVRLGTITSASTSTAGTGEPPVKRQRLSEPGTSSASSLESSKESPRPGPSTRM